MANSIAHHFRDATWTALNLVLNEIALPHPGGSSDLFLQGYWMYPREDTSVSLYDYDTLLNEYEDAAIDRLITTLGDLPSAILCIELRGSQGVRAVDDATRLAVLFLERFAGVVDDLYSA